MAVESLPDFARPARQRWESIPVDIRQRLLGNVWCGQQVLDTHTVFFERYVGLA